MLRRLRSIPRDLGLQLFVLYLLLIVPFLASLLAFDQFVGHRIRADVEANDLSLVRAIAQETDLSIRNSLETVRGLSEYASVFAGDRARMQELFQVVLDTRPDINLVYRLDSQGIMLYHYPVGPGSTVGTDFSFRSYFQRALASEEPLISEGRISPTTEQAVATAVMPIRTSTGQFLGLVATNIRLESLSETLTAITSKHQGEEGFQLAIVDSDEQIIAYPDPSLLLHPISQLIPGSGRLTLGARSGSAIANDEQGEERLYTYSPIPIAGWGVIVSRPTAAAFATQITLRRISLAVAVMILLIGLVFWGALNQRVIRPIEQLAPISEAIGQNEDIQERQRAALQKIQKRRDQIGHLVRSTFRMEDAIRARMREQATLLETSKAVVSTLEPQAVLDRILEQVEKLLGVKMSAIVAHDAASGYFRVRASHGLSNQFTEQLTIQAYEPSSVTVRALHSREPIQVSDTETDPSYIPRRPRARAEGFRSVLAVPLNTKHAPPTALVIYRPTPYVFTESEIGLLVSFANQATMAIENATLFERSDARLQEQTRRLESLIQSLSDGLILSRPDGKVVYANRRVAELANLSQEDMDATSAQNVLERILAKSTLAQKQRTQLKKAISGGDGDRNEIPLTENGRTIYLRLETFGVTDSHGISIGRGLFFHDITADYELDRMKTSLISTVSHELRTPLAAIKGYATTLLAEDVEWDRASQQEFLSVISDESDRLSNLVNNLLDLSRIEAGNLKVSLVECQIEELLSNAARQARLVSQDQLELQIEEQLPPFFADPARIETVVRNLIENSIKYGGKQVAIHVDVRIDHDAFIFRIQDNGPGIPVEESERIFERFYRIDESLARVTSGAGLGLAICRGLVRAHAGDIWVEPGGQGTCIAFSIPAIRKKTPRRKRVAS
jgi:PAS domain S-box-containing protein